MNPLPTKESVVSDLSHSDLKPSDSEESAHKRRRRWRRRSLDRSKKLNLQMQMVKEFARELYESTVQ